MNEQQRYAYSIGLSHAAYFYDNPFNDGLKSFYAKGYNEGKARIAKSRNFRSDLNNKIEYSKDKKAPVL